RPPVVEKVITLGEHVYPVPEPQQGRSSSRCECRELISRETGDVWPKDGAFVVLGVLAVSARVIVRVGADGRGLELEEPVTIPVDVALAAVDPIPEHVPEGVEVSNGEDVASAGAAWWIFGVLWRWFWRNRIPF